MFCLDPVKKLSTQTTSWPRPSSLSHRCEPRKPDPPVTSIRLFMASPCKGRFFTVERMTNLRILSPEKNRTNTWRLVQAGPSLSWWRRCPPSCCIHQNQFSNKLLISHFYFKMLKPLLTQSGSPCTIQLHHFW